MQPFRSAEDAWLWTMLMAALRARREGARYTATIVVSWAGHVRAGRRCALVAGCAALPGGGGSTWCTPVILRASGGAADRA